MAGDIEFQVWTLLAYARPNFFEQPFERITISGIFEIAEEENAFAVLHLGHRLRQRCDYRQMFGGEIRDQLAKMLVVGFGDVENEIGAAVGFDFAPFEIAAAFEVREEAGCGGGAPFAFAVAIVGEDGDAGLRRSAADRIQIMFRHGNAGPKPVAKNCEIELFACEEFVERPICWIVVAEVTETIRVVVEHRDTEIFERLPVTVCVGTVASNKRQGMALCAKLANHVHKAEIGTTAVKVWKQIVNDENLLWAGVDECRGIVRLRFTLNNATVRL